MRLGTAIIKEDKETEKECKKRGESMESKAGTERKRGPDGLSLPYQNTLIIWYGKYFIMEKVQ